MQVNIRDLNTTFTHEGAKTKILKPIDELKRTILSCLLWEDTFYESGESIAERIINLVAKCKPEDVGALALKARTEYGLRHVPLLLIVGLLTRDGHIRAAVKHLILAVINRPDEMGELIAIYWKLAGHKAPLANSLKKGLAECFHKFNEYSFAKNNKKKASVRLRDVMFLTHPKPVTAEEELLFKKIANDTLDIPDTWEVALSAGKDKAETFTRLMDEKRLGGLAFLRNLRNMAESGVADSKIKSYFDVADFSKIFPYRFIAAAQSVPSFEPVIEGKFIQAVSKLPKIEGATTILVDVSGSMQDALSYRSEMSRLDAANALAMMLREVCNNVRIFSFSEYIKEVPLRRGFALADAIKSSQGYAGTYLGKAIAEVTQLLPNRRLIVITDEQSHDRIKVDKKVDGYLINVAPYKVGITYDSLVRINGFSEGVIRFISEYESWLKESK